MTSFREQPPDSQDDSQLEHALKSGYGTAGPSVEYQEELLRRLDQEFVATYHAERALQTATEQQAVANKPPRVGFRVSLRLAITMATAASLLFAVALWNSQTAYGWATMLRALENCNWVQVVSETAGLSGWSSSERGIVAIQSPRQAAFFDQHEHSVSRYDTDRQVIRQQALPAGSTSRSADTLLGLLLAGDHWSDDTSPSYEVVSEAWRRLPARDDNVGNIELRVTLKLLSPQQGIAKLVFLLDPETHLPQSCRVLTKSEGVESMAFHYPASGPDSIFALEVPREAEWIALRDRLHIDNVAEQAPHRESPERQFLSQPTKAASEQADKTLGMQREPAQQQGRSARAIVVEEIVTAPQATTEAGVVQTQPLTTSNPPQADRQPKNQVLPEQALETPELVAKINTQLAAYWQAHGLTPAAPASDSEFLRRVYLDLTGRIPRVDEVYRFLDDPADDRRERLVEELLTSRDHATHLATVWRTMLLPEGVETNTYGGTAKFDEWLADRFAKNLPYDQFVRELLLAEGRVSDSGPILFYAALKLNPEELAAKTARTFLGVRMECAQCHDHPFDPTVSQNDFWGFAAYFAQISRPRGKMEMTSSVLRVHDNKQGEVMLPDSEEVVPPRLPYAASPARPEDKTVSDAEASRSRREVLVDWLTTKQNSRFARAAVNRAWQQLFGLGLVEPVDDMRDDNRAIAPEVLDTLSRNFAASGYDLRQLLRALVLSDAYQLSSRSLTDEPSQGLAFARMNIKSFTADQLYDCISVATEYEAMRTGNAADGSLARIGNTSRQAFIEQFQAPPGQRTDYHAGIPQALTLMHGYLIHGATDLASSGLLKSLNAPFFTDKQRVDTLFLSTLSRYPEEIERAQMLAYVEASQNDAERSQALGDILWALLNSAEFTFIH